MTEPHRPPLPSWPPVSTWCTSCEQFLATALQPLCPVCVDKILRDER